MVCITMDAHRDIVIGMIREQVHEEPLHVAIAAQHSSASPLLLPPTRAVTRTCVVKMESALRLLFATPSVPMTTSSWAMVPGW